MHDSSRDLQEYNDGMDHSKLVVVNRFASQVEADLAKSALESAGIDAMIQADRAGGMRDHLAWSGFGFKVLVREEDAAEARDVLHSPQEASAEPASPNDKDIGSSN
jgi:hypothetical protein